MGSYRVISSDSHVVEPPDLWTTRMEPRFKDRAPHVVHQEDGDWWYLEGVKMTGQANGAQAGERFEAGGDLAGRATFWEDVQPGGYIPEEQIKDMDADGVDAGILYPSVGLSIYRLVEDSELLSSIFRTYNDWLAEFCSPAPKRLLGNAMINVDDVGSGVRELERCAEMGFPGAMISASPFEEYHLPKYDLLWAAAQDLQMPLALHIGTNRPGPGQDFESTSGLAFFCNADHWARMSLFHMFFDGVFDRYPKLQVGAVETELSWVPHFLTQLDYNYTNRPHSPDAYRLKDGALPSDHFRRNVFLSFQEDALGIKQKDYIGVDTLQWGSDYPHIESTFPRSREIIEEILGECTEEEKAKIAGANAARVYHLD